MRRQFINDELGQEQQWFFDISAGYCLGMSMFSSIESQEEATDVRQTTVYARRRSIVIEISQKAVQTMIHTGLRNKDH